MNDTSYYWGEGEIDPDEPDYVEGKGILVTQFTRCTFVPQPDNDICLKHQFIVDSGMEVKMAKVDAE
jgi:hypothetical protein